jgi:predicted O-methyltransferase YrrM
VRHTHNLSIIHADRHTYCIFPIFKMASPTTGHLHQAGKIDAQAISSLLKPSPQLDHALSNSTTTGLPPITVSALQGQYLAIQCRLIGAKSVLEIGTLGGYSTIWFASTGASVTSIEISPKHRDVALENTKGLDVEIILGAALDVLPKLAEEGRKFDLVFIDAAWEEQWEYFSWAVKLTRKNGCIYVDNVVRELLEHETVGENENLVTKVGREENVIATLVSTVSSHKKKVDEMFDGFLLALVKE